MNKFIIFCCLFVAISSLCSEILYNDTMSYYCKNKTLEDTEKKNADSCCYVSYKEFSGREMRLCSPYKKAEVAQIVKNYAKNFSKLTIDCASTWISYRLFLIVLIFII